MKTPAYALLSTAALVAAQGPYGPPAGVLTTISGTVYIIGGAPYTGPYGTAAYGTAPFVYSVDGKLYSAGPGIGAPTVLPTDQPKPLPTGPVTATATSSSSSSSSLTSTTSVVLVAAEFAEPATEIGEDGEAIFTTVAPNGAPVVVRRAAALETLLTSAVATNINATAPASTSATEGVGSSAVGETSTVASSTPTTPVTGHGVVVRLSAGLLAAVAAAAAFLL